MSQRKALVRSLVVALVDHGSIRTTGAKAKELRAVTDKLVTLAKKQTPASRRLLASRVGEATAAKLFKDIAPKFKDRTGGYTRVSRLPRRLSDGSEVAILEFVS